MSKKYREAKVPQVVCALTQHLIPKGAPCTAWVILPKGKTYANFYLLAGELRELGIPVPKERKIVIAELAQSLEPKKAEALLDYCRKRLRLSI